MKKHILFLITCGLLSTHALFAQMSINTTGTQADPSAGLDVDFSNKGLLIPRIALSSKTDATTIPNPATGLMVYNTGTGGLSLAGYYYNAGTSSSPDWVHLSTTGLDGSGEATQVAFWTGTNTLSSNANLYWDNTNSRLGVGTTSPTNAKLQIEGNGTYDGVLRLKNTGTSGADVFLVASSSAWDFGADKLGIGFGNPSSVNVKMTIQSNGNVGIGTTSPSAQLHTTGTVRFANYPSGANGAIVKTDASGNLAITNLTGSTSQVLLGDGTFGSITIAGGVTSSCGTANYIPKMSSSTQMVCSQIYDNGTKVGIGTTSPGAKLEVCQNMSDYSTAFTSPHLNLGTSNTVDNTGFVGITYDASTSENYGWSSGALRSSGGASSFVWKYHNNSAAGTERMRIDQNGYVGIGITSPSAQLHTTGSVRFAGVGSTSVNTQILTRDANGNLAYRDAGAWAGGSDNVNGSGEATRVAFWSGANTLSSNANLYWDNTNSRLGIGTSTPATNLEINGNVLATAFKGTGNYQSVWSSWGNSIWLEKNGHDAIFYNDPATSKGFMIGFHGTNDRIHVGHTTDSWSTGSYLVTIDGEGRVGIRTNPNNSYSLYVDGKGSTTAVRGIYNSTKFGDLGTANYGVYGQSSASIYGYLGGGNGAYGQYNSTRYGMLGNTSYGVFGRYDSNIYGYIGGAHYAVFGTGGTYAGYFNGDVRVTGTLTKGGGSFLIDHPLDPLNKTLRHNFVESTWNMCVYPGKVKLDESGVAKVIMPDYYTALVKEAEAIAQITPVGRPFLTGCEWSEDFSTLIIYGEPDREVYYTVMADRDDPVIHLLAKPIEEEKGNGNFTKGKLLYPEAYGYPETMGEDYQSPDD